MPANAKRESVSKWAGDVWGGLAAALVALPSSIAYGVAIYSLFGADYVSHGVMAGILGATACGLVAPALGGAPRLISSPCAPAAAVLAALAADLLGGGHGGKAISPVAIILLLTVVALLSSGLQFLYGSIGGGRLIKYIPYPVVSGYLSGVGVVIFLSQVPRFFGLPKDVNVWLGLASPEYWRWQGMLVGAATIAGVLLAPKITKAVPAPIIGLFAGVLVYFGLAVITPEMLSLSGNSLVIGPVGGKGVSVFSAVAARWRAVSGLHLSDLKLVLFPALTLSVLLSIDTLKTCVVVDALTRSRHNSNRELIGQSLGNFASALIGGLPGAGTMGATLVNVSSGGQTRFSGVLEGVFVLIAFLLFGSLIAWVPIAALAGILIVVAFRMFDWNSFHLLKARSTLLDFFVIAAVIVVAVEVNLIAASGTGLALAVLLFVREQIHGSVMHRKAYGNQISSKRNRLPSERAILDRHGQATVVCELQGSLFFGTTDRLFTELEPDLPRCRYLILDMRRVQSVDFTAAHLLEHIQGLLKEHGAFLIFSNLPASLPTGQNLLAYFHQVGVMSHPENVKLFDALDQAIEWAEDQLLSQADPLARPNQDLEQPLDLGQIDLLRDLNSEQMLSALKKCVVERSFPAGQIIFRRGEESDELYLIRRGLVRVELPLDGGKHYTVAYFGRGNFFGEMAFLDRGPRSADAVAATEVDLYVLSRVRFNELSATHPLISERVFAQLADVLALRLRYADTEIRSLQET